MLSFLDIKRELGKNIYIHPVHPASIKANSIDLHVSQFGWSLKTRKKLETRNNCLILPPNDTALIYTEESIYVSHKIGGSFHSKVTLVSEGLGHIGTALDAQYIGSCLIAIHNHSDSEYELVIGQEFVTLHLFYLNTHCFKEKVKNDNDPGHPRIIAQMDKTSYNEYIRWRDERKWLTNNMELYHTMVSSDSYKQCKKEYQQELREFTGRRMWHILKRAIICLALLVLVTIVFAVPAYWIDFGEISVVFAKLCETFIYPAFSAIFAVIITKDIIDYLNGK